MTSYRAPLAPDFPTFTSPYKLPISAVGVNLFDGAMAPGHVNYKMPLSPVMWHWWSGRGVNVMRVPFKWERAQPSLLGPLDPDHTQDMHRVVWTAMEYGCRVLWDMHNYAKRDGSSALVGSAALPAAALADVWRKLADEFKHEDSVIGYGLMNEPSLSTPAWPATCQLVIDAIRSVDQRTAIMVPPVGATCFDLSPDRSKKLTALFALHDPADRLVYEAHQYLDRDSSGRYDFGYEAMLSHTRGWGLAHPNDFGVALVDNFTGTLEANGRRGLVGETGIPSGMMRRDGDWKPHWDYRDGWTDALRRMIEFCAARCVPVFIWTDGMHAESNKLYVGHQAPGEGGPVAEMLTELARTNPLIF